MIFRNKKGNIGEHEQVCHTYVDCYVIYGGNECKFVGLKIIW